MFDLSAFRFIQLLQTIKKAQEREYKEELANGAFIGWQITEFLKGALSKKAKQTPFKDYLKQFNLLETPKTTPAQRKSDVKRMIEKAEKLRKLDKRKKAE